MFKCTVYKAEFTQRMKSARKKQYSRPTQQRWKLCARNADNHRGQRMYVLSVSWISLNMSIFKYGVWSCTRRKDHKTNNASEGWHNKFRIVVGKHHPDLYFCLTEFQKEQAYTEACIAELALGKKVKTAKSKMGRITNENPEHSTWVWHLQQCEWLSSNTILWWKPFQWRKILNFNSIRGIIFRVNVFRGNVFGEMSGKQKKFQDGAYVGEGDYGQTEVC